jgi:ubiquinone biosynthesis protein COQ4
MSDGVAYAFKFHPVRPIAALTAMIRLIIDPQDTPQVAELVNALAGKCQAKTFDRFVKSPNGRQVLAQKRRLVETLDNHAFLRALPENSLGRHYLAFVEQENLSAQGLHDATPSTTARLAQLPEPMGIFYNYTTRDTHDLYHVLNGYGREELGEICVLAMTYEQLRLRGYIVIFSVGALVVSRKFLRPAKIATKAVWAAVREAREIGKTANWIPAEDIEAMLAEDITALRARLNLRPPVIYNQIIQRIRANSPWRHGPFAGVLAA